MRDINFNKTYFENYISKEKNDRIERILKLKNNEIKEERIVFVKSFGGQYCLRASKTSHRRKRHHRV